MAWNGYRASRAACGGAYNGYRAPKAKQDWAVGEIVNVGFVKGLMVDRKQADGSYLLHSRTGARYSFQPHMGLSRI